MLQAFAAEPSRTYESIYDEIVKGLHLEEVGHFVPELKKIKRVYKSLYRRHQRPATPKMLEAEKGNCNKNFLINKSRRATDIQKIFISKRPNKLYFL